MNHRERERTIAAGRVVNQLVEHHPAIRAEGEERVVVEHDADSRAVLGFDDVALEHRRIGLEHDTGAVGARGGDRAFNRNRAANRLGARAGLELGVLARRERAGKLGDELGRQHRAARRHQGRRIGKREVVLDENRGAVRPDEQKVRALADEIGDEQQGAVGYDQRRPRRRLENDDFPTTFGPEFTRQQRVGIPI